MQTFLPFADYTDSARALDNRRLGKQRVECLQILKALSDPNYGWQNHPAVKMWQGNFAALIGYGLAVCREWKARGFKDTCIEKIGAFGAANYSAPGWATREFCLSHQSNLIRKDPAFYGPKFPDAPADLPYVWPL